MTNVESVDIATLDKLGGSCSTSLSGSFSTSARRNSQSHGQLDADDREPQSSAVRVVVRFRPLLSLDGSQQEEMPSAWMVDPEASCVESTDLQHRFQFDRTLTENTTQESVYNDVGKPVVDDVLQGYHGTVLAYGQTGSGKTYCIFGPSDQNSLDLQGLVPRAAQQVFDRINLSSCQNSNESKFVTECTLFEVYNEQLRDLLKPGNTKLQVKELPPKGCFIEGLTHKTVTSVNEVLQVLRAGLKHRAAANTRLNNHSSRSHAIFTLRVQQQTDEGTTKNGKLTLVDLAGSEKVYKSGSEGDMLEEAKKINLSLSALGHVIDSLADRRPHVPYRDSRLTRILEDSLGGNCRTTLLVACAPSITNFSETLSSLRFAARAKRVCNYARINVTYACDRQLLSRIAHLRKELAKAHHQLERRFSNDAESFPTMPSAAAPSKPSNDGSGHSSSQPRLVSSVSGSSITSCLTNSIPGRAVNFASSGESTATETLAETSSCTQGHELRWCEMTKPWFCRRCVRVSSQSLMDCYRCNKCNYNLCDLCYSIDATEGPIAGASREDPASEELPTVSSIAKQSMEKLSELPMSNYSCGMSTASNSGASSTSQTLRLTGTPRYVAQPNMANGMACEDVSGRRYKVAMPLGDERKLPGSIVSAVAPKLRFGNRSTAGLEGLQVMNERNNSEDLSVRELQMRLELERHRCASLSLELEHRTQESKTLQRELEDKQRPQSVVLTSGVMRSDVPVLANSGGSMPVLPLVATSVEAPIGRVVAPSPSAVRLQRLHSVQRAPSSQSPGRGHVVSRVTRTATTSPVRVNVCSVKTTRSHLAPVGTPRGNKSPQSARDPLNRHGPLPGRHVFGTPRRSTSPCSSAKNTPRGQPSPVIAASVKPAVVLSPRDVNVNSASQSHLENITTESSNVQLWLV